MKNKGIIIFAIFIVAAIIAFAIYKAAGKTNTSIITSGGSQTHANNGIGGLIASGIGGLFASFKGLFSGSNSGEAPLAGDNSGNTDYSNVG